MKTYVIDYMRLLRIPGLLGLAITPVLGALSVGTTCLPTLAALFFIGAISKIYGFVMNDYYDVKLDSLSPDLSQRALVKKTVTKKQALFIIFSCFGISYLAIFAFFYQNIPTFYIGLIGIIIADILSFIYNKYGKRFIGSDFLIALAESLFFLFGALVVLPNGYFSPLVWILFIILFNEQLYMNAIVGGLKDSDHDYLLNVQNIALVSGVKVGPERVLFVPLIFKIFALGERLTSSFLIFAAFLFLKNSYHFWQIALLIPLVILLIYLCLYMLNRPRFDRKELRKLIGLQLLIWHPCIPIILVSIVGILYPLLLIVVPITSYLFFSRLMGQKLNTSQI